MRILAVDDDPSILELIPMITANLGFPDVTAVLSGDRALEVLTTSPAAFDCLLFDIQMPGMDGIELCRHVRALPAYRKTPIIMLTAMTQKDYVDRAFKAGATDYATKPFDITELGARLRIAQELIKARKVVPATDDTNDDRLLSPVIRHDFDLSDPIQIEGYKDMVDHVALGNYLFQLSRTGAACSQVLAIKIDRIDAIYARASTDEFIYVLSETVEAIRDAFKTIGYLMAYTGNGIFLIVSSSANPISSLDMETEVQSLLDERNSEYDNGDPLDIEVSIGNLVRPSTSKTQGIRKTFDRAIGRAEKRAIKKRHQPRPLGIPIIGR